MHIIILGYVSWKRIVKRINIQFSILNIKYDDIILHTNSQGLINS